MKKSAVSKMGSGSRGFLRAAVFSVVGIGCLAGGMVHASDGEGGQDSAKIVGNKFRFVKHLVKSHTVDLVTAPVSAVGDLATFVAGTGVSWINRLDIRVRRAPIVNRKPIPELSEDKGMDLAEFSHQPVLIP